jgi:translocation protein SEC63
MAAAEENSSLFLIFVLTMIALPLVPYTILRLCRAASEKVKTIHCRCSGCHRSGKYRKSIYKRVRTGPSCSLFCLNFLCFATLGFCFGVLLDLPF